MLKQLRFAAVALLAGGVIAFTTGSGWAFTQETVSPNANGNYNFNYTNPDAKSGDSTNKFDSGNPSFHFSIDRNQSGPFGFRNFNDNNNSNSTPPDLYTPHGGGN